MKLLRLGLSVGKTSSQGVENNRGIWIVRDRKADPSAFGPRDDTDQWGHGRLSERRRSSGRCGLPGRRLSLGHAWPQRSLSGTGWAFADLAEDGHNRKKGGQRDVVVASSGAQVRQTTF